MFRFFVDDSGKEPQDSPAFILAGWGARVDDWERFSEAWEISIAASNPKSLGYNKGYRYFSNHEATGQTGCFVGFTPREAALKTANLAHLIVGMNPRIAGFTVTVPHDKHQAIVKAKAIRKRGGDVRLEQKLPFYIAFSHMVPTVHALHYHAGFRDKLDFIFDGNKTDKALRNCITVYEEIREGFKDEVWYPLMGEMIPGDDKELAPLQAADMYAGQLRQSIMQGKVQGAIKLWDDNNVKMKGLNVGESDLEKWSQDQNEEYATKILSAIKERRENPQPRPMSQRRKKKPKKP